MSDIRQLLQRIEGRVSMPEPAISRLIRRRERRQRTERIVAASVGLGVAVAGVVGAVATLRIAGRSAPASGGAATASTEGGGLVLPTIAIWTAIVVLGLTVFAAVRLRARFAGSNGDTEDGWTERDDAAAPARRRAGDPAEDRTRGASEMDSKPKTEVVGLAGAEVPAIRFDDGKLRRTNRWLVGAVVVLALAVVALGAGLIAASGEEATPAPPSETSARAIVPYTTGSVAEAEIAFDGTHCRYTGPTEMAAGTDAVFRFTGPADSGLTLGSLAPGVTWEQVERSGDRYPPSDPPSWVIGAQSQIGSGTLRASALGEGLYFLGCATGPTSSDHMFPAVMLRVIGA